MIERRIIKDPDTIALLLDTTRVTMLLPFRLRPCTAAGAARERGVKPNLMAYWVERFVEAGLLEPVEADAAPGEKRRGQHYRTTAGEFILLPGDGFAASEIVERQYGDLWRKLRDLVDADTDTVASRWAIKVFLHEGRFLVRQEVPVELVGTDRMVPAGNALNLWLTLRFDRATAEELRAELEELFVRYSRRGLKDRPDVPRHYLHIALAKDTS